MVSRTKNKNQKNEITLYTAHPLYGLYPAPCHTGGWYTFEGYFSLWTQMASYGFVIVATKSCTLGCKIGGWDKFCEPFPFPLSPVHTSWA